MEDEKIIKIKLKTGERFWFKWSDWIKYCKFLHRMDKGVNN